MSISLFTLSCQCLTGDTLVSTEDGDVRIDEIRPGDKIWTNNVETGKKELQEVKSVKETKTANGGVTSPSKKDVKQLYEYLTNGKYH